MGTDSKNQMSDAPKYPIEGMTVMPAYLHLPMMDQFFVNLLFWGLAENDVLDRFKDETGIDMVQFVKLSPLEAMVDRATGYMRDCFVKFADWMALNYWGVHGSEGKEEDP